MRIKIPKITKMLGLSHTGGWHWWFAWYPVKVSGYVVWLEYVNRKRIYSDPYWMFGPRWIYEILPKSCRTT